jgi:hypothetical protein
MVERHYQDPHRMICITDDPNGIDPRVTTVPLWDLYSDLVNPTWPRVGPNCYPRLFAFSHEFERIVGRRFVSLDLDVAVTRDLRPLWNRTEDFVMWHTGMKHIPYCASMFMLTTGSRERVWSEFDPIESPKLTRAARLKGSDQAWIHHCLGPTIPSWGAADGVYSYGEHIIKGHDGDLPDDARVVMFTGRPDPWNLVAQQRSPWISDHYTLRPPGEEGSVLASVTRVAEEARFNGFTQFVDVR